MEVQGLPSPEGGLKTSAKQGQSKTDIKGEFVDALMALLGPNIQAIPPELAGNIILPDTAVPVEIKGEVQEAPGGKVQGGMLQQILPEELQQTMLNMEGVVGTPERKEAVVQQQVEFQKAAASLQEIQQTVITKDTVALKGLETGEKTAVLAEEVNKTDLKLEKQWQDVAIDNKGLDEKTTALKDPVKNKPELQAQEIKATKPENILINKTEVKPGEGKLIDSQQVPGEEGKDLTTPEKKEISLNQINMFQITDDEGMKVTGSKNFETKMNVKELPEKLPELVKSQVKLLDSRNDNKDITIQLEPKELGKTIVKLSAEEGVVTVKILAEHASARAIIEQGVQQLKQSLAEQGIKYGRVDVELAGQFTDQGQHQQPHWQQNRGYRNTGAWNIEDYYGEDDLANETGVQGLIASGSVDYMA